ncbi:MAG: glutaredoxin [Pyramidobacter sp.]|jgi:glutaredoxin-related protein
MKVMVYGTLNCPDTVAALEEYKKRGIDVDFKDIDGDIKTLKDFLRLRDTKDIFESVRTEHKVGVPLVIAQGKMTLDWREIL